MRAFAAIYQRYHQSLFRYCLSILRDEADAQDALQSTFERALSALRRSNRNAPLRPWLYRIAHNEAITVIRRRTPNVAPEHLGVVHEPSAAHVAEERDRLTTLVSDLAQLPERPRSALVMRELIGLSHEDIAVALDTSLGAAKQAIFEARQGLAETVEGREMSCDDVREVVSDGDRRVLRGRRIRAHLRGCAGCAEFAQAIGQRRADLRALAPPLAPAAAASILAGLGGHGTTGGLSAASAGAGGLGKGALAGTIGSKAAIGAAVIATAGLAGVAAIKPLVRRPPPGPARTQSAAPARRAVASAAPLVARGRARPVVSGQSGVVRVRLVAERRRSALVTRREPTRERHFAQTRAPEVPREPAHDRLRVSRSEPTTRTSARETRDRSSRSAPVRRRTEVTRQPVRRTAAK